MKPLSLTVTRSLLALSLAVAATAGVAADPAHTGQRAAQHTSLTRYQQTNLVSDGAVAANHIDANLRDPWGLAFNPFGFVWVANARSGTSTLYDGNGAVQPLVVQIPTHAAANGGKPTGTIYNGSSGFVIGKEGRSGPARFVFATLEGVIAAWSPGVDTLHALPVAGRADAIYTALALGADGERQLLYATDIRGAKLDVYDSAFVQVRLEQHAFVDPRLPSGYTPFGVQAINGNIYVAYAKQNADHTFVQFGRGFGLVSAFTPDGKFIKRIASGGDLNAPWGIALAPADFGIFSNALLVGNFGDGTIHGYETLFDIGLGPMRDQYRKPIRIEGLWGIAFGNGLAQQPVSTLFFAGGIGRGQHGLYGRLEPVR